jgi:hypothetical protein
METELAVVLGEAKALISRKIGRGRGTDGVPDKSLIDIGPFLRQEGRAPTWDSPVLSPREDVISRLRLELGFPSEPFQRAVLRGHKARRPARDLTAWMGSLFQRIRLPG